jgi:hypothetical protein
MAGRNLFASAEPVQEPVQPVAQGRNLFAQEPEQPSFPGAAVAEPLATLATGAIAEPIAGLAGLARAAFAPSPEEAVRRGAETVGATREALTFQPRTQAGQEGLQAVGGVLAPVGEALQAAETFLGDETFEATGSPALAAAAATIPTAAIEALGLASTKGFLKRGARVKKVKEAKKVQKAVVEAAPDLERIKEVSRGVYKEIDDAGVRLLPKAYAGMVNKVEESLKGKGFHPKVTPKAAGALEAMKDELGKVQTLSDIDNLRKIAQSAAKSTEAADAALGVAMIDSIDSFLDSATQTAFARGAVKAADIVPKYKVARELWGRARRSELINDAFEKAGRQASGFENGIVTQFRRILNNKNQKRYFKPKEIAAMDDVVKGVKGASVAKLIGRFGFSEGHATNILGGSIGSAAGFALGGPVGAASVAGIGQVSRKLAQKLTLRGSKLADSVVRAGDDGERIARAYLSQVPKAQRSATELSELLLRPDIAIDQLGISKNSFIREAAEIAQGQRVLKAVGEAATVAAPGAIQTQRSE